MEQCDYLLRQIQQMAQFFAAVIRKLTGLKEENSEEEIQQATDEMLLEQLDLQIPDILKRQHGETAEWIVKKKGIHIQNLDLFAEILLLNAKACKDDEKKQQLLEAILEIYCYADQHSDTFSMDRQVKAVEVKKMLRL